MTEIKIKTAWHIWAIVGGQVHTENWSGTTKRTLIGLPDNNRQWIASS